MVSDHGPCKVSSASVNARKSNQVHHRVLALQNSSKCDGMPKMRLENSKHFPLESTKGQTKQEQNPCFVSRLFTARLLCLIGSKGLCALKRVLTLAKANSLFSKKCVETKTNVCEIVTAPWNNGKEVLKWHKFASCATTLLVKNQNARASHCDVECKGRWFRTAIHTTALQNFATEPCVVPFPGLLSKPVDRNTHFADASVACLQSRQ